MAPAPKPPPVTSWWLCMDLGKTVSLTKLTILWDAASGSSDYSIQGSLDNITWTNLQANLSSVGGTKKEHAVSGTYRYLRIYINKAQKSYPIIYEVKLYGENVVVDTTPPTGTVTINSGANYTNSPAVSLSLSAADTGSGMGTGAQMQFSNDNKTWSSPEAYAAGKSWSLPAGDGTKTVYVKFKDAAGNWSAAYSDTIILDTAKPAIAITQQ
jgi:hypothetical protein